jgi:hypothetical protein
MNAGCHREKPATKYQSHGATKVSSTQECNMCVAGTKQYFYIHFGVSNFMDWFGNLLYISWDVEIGRSLIRFVSLCVCVGVCVLRGLLGVSRTDKFWILYIDGCV